MIPRRTVFWLGVSQMVYWGITYYLIGGFGTRIAEETGWSHAIIHGGFSLALLVMGLISPHAGRMIDRHGGARLMSIGSVFAAAGCAGVALAHDVVTYYLAWIALGVAMRLTLYDAAFAALARLGGLRARRPISQITLLGGLASTVFWPFGNWLADLYGWRNALLVYAAIALLTLPLHLSIPNGDHRDLPPTSAEPEARPQPEPPRGRDRTLAALLYAFTVTALNFLNAGMSAHMIGILGGLGLTAGTAVWIASLRGIGQSSARLAEVLFGKRLDPLNLNLLAAAALPVSFAAGFGGDAAIALAVVFAAIYGAGNGIMSITRGTLPLVLFGPHDYGTVVGRLLTPSFVFAAASPTVYAAVIDWGGARAGLVLSLVLAAAIAMTALILKRKFGR